MLTTPWAIMIAGGLVVGAILIAFRWQISATPGIVYRLDSWTGNIGVCYRVEGGALRCQDFPFAW